MSSYPSAYFPHGPRRDKYFLRINLFPLYSLPDRYSNTLEMTTWATEVGIVHET